MLPGGFAAPKINTSFFSSGLGKIQSTLANAKSPTLNIQPPQLNINQIQASTEQLASTTKDWGFSAFKTLSSAAQRVSNNVTQGIQKEHEEFLKQKKMDNVIPHQGTGESFFFFLFFALYNFLRSRRKEPSLHIDV